MKMKYFACLCVSLLATVWLRAGEPVKEVRALDRLATAQGRGEWIVIKCPKDDVNGRDPFTVALRADQVTSMVTVRTGTGDDVYPVDIEILTRETAFIGQQVAGSRAVRIPAGTNETAPALLTRLADMMDHARTSAARRRAGS